MNIEFSRYVDKELRKIRKNNSKLSIQIQSKLILFVQNPQHPSLRLHKLTANLDNMWSISISSSIRMVYIIEGDIAYFINIGTHDQVYRK